MRRSRRLGALACVLLVVLAGCGAQEVGSPGSAEVGTETTTGPTADATDGSATADPTIGYRGGDLAFAPEPVFDRAETLLGENATPPTEVTVENATTWFGGNVSERRPPSGTGRFGLLLGVEPERNHTDLRATPNGATDAFGGVRIYPGEGSAAALEVVLAHEFVHVVQFQRDRVSEVRQRVGSGTTDGRWTARSVVEGVAVWAETRYVERYDVDAPTGGERTATLYEQARPGTPFRYGQSAYLFGYDYVRNRTQGLDAVDEVYGAPPTTSEQVIHELPPGVEPAANLSVLPRGGGEWRGTVKDTLGEAYTRVVLANGVPLAESRAAAAGWGNDRLVTYRDEPTANASYVWVTRWDTAADATEFAAAMNGTFDAAGDRRGNGDRWGLDGSDAMASLERPDETTVVVTVGETALHAALTVSLDGSTVVLATNESTTPAPQTTTPGASYVLA